MRLFTLTTLLPFLAVVSAAPARKKCSAKHTSASGLPSGTPTQGFNAVPFVASSAASSAAPSAASSSPSVDTEPRLDLLVVEKPPISSAHSSSAVVTNTPATVPPGSNPTETTVPSSAAAPGPSSSTATKGDDSAAETTTSTTSSSNLMFDKSLTIQERQRRLSSWSDDDLFNVVGQPVFVGTSGHLPELKQGIANLTRLSVGHAQQVRDLVKWGVTVKVNDNPSTSFFTTSAEDHAGSVEFSPNSIGPGVVTLIAHEMGHAVFAHQNFLEPMTAAVKQAGFDDQTKYGDVAGMLNEAFANVWADHAGAYNHPDWYNATGLAHDTKKSLSNGLEWILFSNDVPPTNWRNTYHLTDATKGAMAQILAFADPVVFPRLTQLYDLDQKIEPRGY